MKKLLPYSLVCVDEIEKWLNEMALKGYYLVKLNSIFATFEEGEPWIVKYSLVYSQMDNVKDKNKTNEPDLDIHQEYGWKLIQKEVRFKQEIERKKPSYFSVYQSIMDKPTKDIQRDILSIEYLAKPVFMRIGWMFYFFVLMLNVVSTAYHAARIGTYYNYFIDRLFLAISMTMPFIIICIFLTYQIIRLLTLRRYYKSKRSKLKRNIKPRLMLITIIFVFGVAIGMFLKSNELTKQKDAAYLGHIDNLVNLRVIEGEHSTYLKDYALDDYYEGYSNFAAFMPLHYLVREYSTTSENEESNIYAKVIYTKAYITFPFDKYMENYYEISSRIDRGLNDNDKIYYTDKTYFDEVLCYDKAYNEKDKNALPSYLLIFRSKYELLEIDYRGNRTPEEIIANVEAVFSDSEE